MQRTLGIIDRRDSVHLRPSCDYRDLLVYCPEAFQVSEVSLYTCEVNRR